MSTGWALVSFVSKGPTLRAVAKLLLLQTRMVVLGAWLSHESRFFHSQIPFHQLVTFLLLKPLFSSLCQVPVDTWSSPVTAGKQEGEMEDGFWPLEQGQLVQLWRSTGCRKALFFLGDRIRPTDAGLNSNTTQPPKASSQPHLQIATCCQALPSNCPSQVTDTLGTSRDLRWRKCVNVFWEQILCMMYLWKVEVFLNIYLDGYCNAIVVFIKRALSECVVSRAKNKLVGFRALVMLLWDW